MSYLLIILTILLVAALLYFLLFDKNISFKNISQKGSNNTQNIGNNLKSEAFRVQEILDELVLKTYQFKTPHIDLIYKKALLLGNCYKTSTEAKTKKEILNTLEDSLLIINELLEKEITNKVLTLKLLNKGEFPSDLS